MRRLLCRSTPLVPAVVVWNLFLIYLSSSSFAAAWIHPPPCSLISHTGPKNSISSASAASSSSSSLTQLMGVRTAIRNSLSKFQRRRPEGASEDSSISNSNCNQHHNAHLDTPEQNNAVPAIKAASFSSPPPPPLTWNSNDKENLSNDFYYQKFQNNHPFPSLTELEDSTASTAIATATATVAKEWSTATTDSSLYSLPPVPEDRPLTSLEQEFRNMLQHFANYTTRDIQSLRDPRTRAIFEGVAASAYDPAVYRAFEVLFEDVYPLRLAGRMVYTNLQHLMETSQCERANEVQSIVQRTGLAERDVEEARLAFVSLAAQMNGDAFLTLDQLKQTELVYIAEDMLGFDHVDAFFERLVATSSSSQKQQSNNKNHNKFQ